MLKLHEHQHCVFTLPKRVRPFFKFRRDLHGHLYRAAWESWKELILEQCPTGTPAAVLALHSHVEAPKAALLPATCSIIDPGVLAHFAADGVEFLISSRKRI